MSLGKPHLFIFLSAIFVFSSFQKSDSGPGAPPDPVMTITSISPASGPSSTLVTIKGTNFSAGDSVYFNGKNAIIAYAGETQLTVKVPPQADTGNICITANGKSITGPVFTFTGNTYLVSTFAGSVNAGSADGTGKAAGFNTPASIAIDRQDNLYIADYGNNKIRKIIPTGVVTTFAGSGADGSVDATGTEASFEDPTGVAVDSNGNLYIADYLNNKIRKITSDGEVSTFAGGSGIGSAEGIGTVASFSYPTNVAVDGSGNLFVADRLNRKIRKITPSGVVSMFAGSGMKGSADGTAATASFNALAGMNFDAAGNLYAADLENNNIRKITRDGIVTTIAGGSVAGGYANGTGHSALFNGCTSIAVDGNGFMYVADQGNEVIRQITPDGVVTLLAGSVGFTGADDGPAVKAKFVSPIGVVIDSHGNIFVAESGNNRIRKLTPQ